MKRRERVCLCVCVRELHNQSVWTKLSGGDVWSVLIRAAPACVSTMFYGGFSTLSPWEIENWCSTRGNEASYWALGRSSISSPPSITPHPPMEGAGCATSYSPPAVWAVSNVMYPAKSMHTSCHFLLQLFPLCHFHLTAATHICISSACQVWNLHLAAWLHFFLCLFQGTWHQNFKEVLIISPPAAAPSVLQANHNSVTSRVYCYLFYWCSSIRPRGMCIAVLQYQLSLQAQDTYSQEL